MGRPGVHRGRHRDDRARRARRDRERPDPARPTAAVHANRDAAPLDGAARHLPVRGDDSWIAIACRHDDDWAALAGVIGEPWAKDARWRRLAGRLAPRRTALDAELAAWTREQRAATRSWPRLRAAGVPGGAGGAAAGAHRRATPTPRRGGCGRPCSTPSTGRVRVDGLPVHLSADGLADRARRPSARRGQRARARPRCSACRPTRSGGCRRGGHLMSEPASPRATEPPARSARRAPRRRARHEHVAFAGKLLADLGADVDRRRAARRLAAAHVRAVPRRRARARAQPVVVALPHVASAASSLDLATRRRRRRRATPHRRRRRRCSRASRPGRARRAGLDWSDRRRPPTRASIDGDDHAVRPRRRRAPPSRSPI